MNLIGRLSHIANIVFNNTFVLFHRGDEQFTLHAIV